MSKFCVGVKLKTLFFFVLTVNSGCVQTDYKRLELSRHAAPTNDGSFTIIPKTGDCIAPVIGKYVQYRILDYWHLGESTIELDSFQDGVNVQKITYTEKKWRLVQCYGRGITIPPEECGACTFPGD